MVKIFFELLQFLLACAPLLVCVGAFALVSVALSKSIKKHPAIYYIITVIPFLMIAVPSIGGMFGVDIPSLTRIPVLGQILRDYIHMGTFGHPLLIVIMYMGALNPKHPWVGRLMSVRRELSVVSGFPVFTHSLIRITNNLPGAVTFFTDNDQYMTAQRVGSELGAGLSSFSFILGVLMLIIFIPLWVTSFKRLQRRMGRDKWKKLHRWSYVFYATLFIHAMGIQVGGMLNPREGTSPRVAVEAAPPAGNSRGQATNDAALTASERGDGQMRATPDAGKGNTPAGATATGRRVMPKGFSDFKVSAPIKRYIHLISLILIYGSYLFLRVRKARRRTEKSSSTGKHAQNSTLN